MWWFSVDSEHSPSLTSIHVRTGSWWSPTLPWCYVAERYRWQHPNVNLPEVYFYRFIYSLGFFLCHKIYDQHSLESCSTSISNLLWFEAWRGTRKKEVDFCKKRVSFGFAHSSCQASDSTWCAVWAETLLSLPKVTVERSLVVVDVACFRLCCTIGVFCGKCQLCLHNVACFQPQKWCSVFPPTK